MIAYLRLPTYFENRSFYYSGRVKSGSQDEFGDLAKSFNQTIDSLRAESQLIERENCENEALVLNIFSPAIATNNFNK